MKRIAFVLAVVVSMYSCKPKTTGAFVVSGKIADVPSQQVFLQELPLDGSQPVIVDSGTLSKTGTFELRALGKEQGLYFVGVQNGPQAIIVNDNPHIQIEFSASNFRHPKIENSDATNALYSFIDDYMKQDAAINSTYAQVEVAQKNNNDSALQAYQNEGLQQINQLNSYVKNFVRNTNSPAAAHFAISQLARMQTMPEKDLLALTTEAANRFKDHQGLAVLKQRLTLAAAQSAAPPDYALLNQQAPDLTMNDVNGKPTSISSFKGKYLLVDFWASWCGPCRQENPNVVAAYNKYKDKNFTILGVSLDQDKQAWLDAIKKDNLAWNHMSDLKYWDSEAVKAYGFDGIPFNVLIDPSGKIIASSLRGADLDNKLAEVLK